MIHQPELQHRFVTSSDFFRGYRERRQPLVLATIIHTIGSTYRKAGAQMLLAEDGSAAGLLSGGCLEADLMERARIVLKTGEPMIAEYDTRSSDDLIWGIGLGCEGAMQILLTPLHEARDYQPYAYIDQCRKDHVAASYALVTASNNPAHAIGSAYWASAGNQPPPQIQAAMESMIASGARNAAISVQAENVTFLVAAIALPTRLLVLGAGPDAMPLVEIAGLMGWHVDVLDHRPAYAISERFPRAQHVTLSPANMLGELLNSARDGAESRAQYDAAVVMSHHLISDEAYLRALAGSDIQYIGLLGPAPRRARLLGDIGEQAQRLGHRLFGPIGLDIGANTPETIALAIVSEIQAVLAGRPGGAFSGRVIG